MTAAIEAEGLRPFARRAGIGLGALRSYLNENDPLFSNMLSLSRAVGLDLSFGRQSELAVNDVEISEFAPVPVYDAALAAGTGQLNEGETVIAHLAFRRDWLQRIGLSPAAALIARADGPSMEPTIHSGDMVLIDSAHTAPPLHRRDSKDNRPARIFALRDDGGARIKRVDLAAPGMLAILSDNTDFPPEFRPVSEVQIIGRVVWWGHTDRE